jgi:NADPH:quinone reductase-like Zn-dependent oxidoreductase
MTRLKKALIGTATLASLALVSLAIAISYNAPCTEPVSMADAATPMRGITYRCYGPPEVLKLEQLAKPVAEADQVLVKVHAAAVNPLDWHYMRGEPYVMRLGSGFGAPDNTRLGVDFSGTVEAVGSAVTRFKPGDEVYGGRNGALADYVVVGEDRAIVRKPANVSHEQAAAVPIAAVTALQGLRDQGKLTPGQKVLINGASGGVGTFAVQIAKSLGAEVTGVCSTRNVELVRSLGADRVVDYTQEDFTAGEPGYDLILDNVGNRSLADLRRALKPTGKLVIVGGPSSNPWLGPLVQVIKASVMAPFVDQQMGMFVAELNAADLEILGDLMRDGKLRSVIDRRFTLEEAPTAIEYLESGRARGKVLIIVDADPAPGNLPAIR